MYSTYRLVLIASLLLWLPNAIAQDYEHNENFGSQGNTPGTFSEGSTGIAFYRDFDEEANDTISFLAITDSTNHRVQVFDTSGGFKFSFGQLGSGSFEFKHPSGIAATYTNTTSTIYICDTFNHRIVVALGINGARLALFGELGSGPRQFNSPRGIAASNDLTQPYLFVSDTGNNRIQVLERDGSFKFAFGEYGISRDQMQYPIGIAFLEESAFVVSVDVGGQRLQYWDITNNTGSIIRTVGQLDVSGSLGSGEFFTSPVYLTANQDQQFLYVTDRLLTENVIQIFDKNGDTRGGYGDVGGGDKEFRQPLGIVDDPEDNFTYIMDTYNFRVQSVNSRATPLEVSSDVVGIVTTFFINIGLALLFVGLFVISKTIPYLRQFYEANCTIWEPYYKKRAPLPDHPPPGWYQWIFATIKVSNEDIYKYHGLDAWVYIKFLQTSLKLVFLYAVYGCIVLIMVNIFAGSNASLPEDNAFFVTGIDEITMANIPNGSNFLWFHMVGVIYNTFVTLWVLKAFYENFLHKRFHYLGQEHFAENYTVMIRDIPIDPLKALALLPGMDKVTDFTAKGMKNVAKRGTSVMDRASSKSPTGLSNVAALGGKGLTTFSNLLGSKDIPSFTDQEIMDYLNPLYNNRVIEVHRVQELNKLRDAHQHRIGEVEEIEKYLAIWAKNKHGERPKLIKKIKDIAKNVKDVVKLTDGKDAIDHHVKALKKADKKLIKKMGKADKYCKDTGVAFATLNTIGEAVKCSQSEINRDWKVTRAPELKDIIWMHLDTTRNAQIFRSLIVAGLCFLLIFFWTIPVGFVQTLSNLETLANTRGLEWLESDLPAVIKGFLEGFLPALVLIVFMAILVPILRFLTKMQQQFTRSEAETSVMVKFFIFLVFNVFLVSTIAGAILKVIEKIRRRPEQIITLLASSLPQQATFFINYIIVEGIAAPTLDLWRPIDLVVAVITDFLAKTKREKRDIWFPGAFEYAEKYAHALTTLLIIMVYSTMAPLILPFGMLYFVFSLLADKYNVMWAMKQPFEGGGAQFLTAWTLIIVGLIMYQLTLIGVFAANSFPYGAIVITCMVLTVLFYIWIRRRYARIHKYGVLADLPHNIPNCKIKLKNVYLQKYLKPPTKRFQVEVQADTQVVPYKSNRKLFVLHSEVLSAGTPKRDVEAGSDRGYHTPESGDVELITRGIVSRRTMYEKEEDSDFEPADDDDGFSSDSSGSDDS